MSVARCFQAAFRKPAQRPAILKAQTPHARHSTGICKAVAADISGVNSSEFVSPEPLASGDASLSGTATQHKTKVICTIGPSTSSPDALLKLAKNGMDVARLNMTHSDLPWHKAVIDQIKTLNQQGFNIAIMVDTEGSEVHLKAQDPTRVETGDKVVFSVRPNGDTGANHFQVSYEGFVDDVRVGDFLFVDGGMAIVRVISIDGPDVTGQVMEPGRVMSRATVTLRRGKELVRGNNSTLPVVTAKDWQDIDFAIDNKVDFVAISFVRDANIISNVRAYINSRLEERHPGHVIDVVAKIEAYDSISALPSIVDAADAIMVARSDLGAQIPMEDVPAVQKEVVFRCRQAGKPVIVASQLLSSMMDVPVPTRAEVADCADAVRQQADALMLSAETAAGQHPLKAVKVMRQVFSEVEDWVAREKSGAIKLSSLSTDPSAISSEEICTAAVNLASQLGAKAILVYTRTGSTAGFVSRRRPDCLVLAITDSETIFRRLTLRWGVTPMLLPLDSDPERNVQATFSAVRDHDVLKSGDLVVVVSDIVACDHTVRSVQIRHIV